MRQYMLTSGASRRVAMGLAAIVAATGGYALLRPAEGSTAAPVTKNKFFSADDFRGTHVGTGAGWDAIGLGSQICNGNGEFRAEADLPDGARVTRMTFFFTDNSGSANFQFGMVAFRMGPDGTLTIDDDLTPPSGSHGAVATGRKVEITPASPIVVDNAARDLELSVFYDACGEDLILHGARVRYEVS